MASAIPQAGGAVGMPAMPAPEVTVIAPTFNERKNVLKLIESVKRSLTSCTWEIVFVDDDSPDETADAVRAVARADTRVRCIQRIGRRGLSTACVEGMLASSAPFLAVIDADLQHDEKLLPQMLQLLRDGGVDIVIGSRYASGGSTGNWNTSRLTLSRLATRLCQPFVPEGLSDPMSGFFMLRREVLMDSVRNLSTIGFKLLVDLFASSPHPLRFIELPYHFRNRCTGESKFDSVAAWDYGLLLLDKSVGHVVPTRFIAFSLVGAAGVVVHFLILVTCFRLISAPFIPSQIIATLGTMTFNFALNNMLTYRDRRLRGWGWLRGLVSFALVCSVGALSNIGIASYFYRANVSWIPSALAGVVVGAVFNFAATSVFTWHSPRRTVLARRTDS